jgi:FkbM family methyltransferase
VFHRFNWTPTARMRNRIMAEAETVQPFFLLALGKECRTFLDVGAMIGAYSLFATQLPKLERCIAIEANPVAAKELRANIKLNNSAIEVIEAAVSDHDGKVAFGVVSEFAGDNAVMNTALHNGFKSIVSVPSITLDSITNLPEPICLKIDVEGHELAVLKGAHRILKKSCVIQVEDFSGATRDALEPLGYSRLTAIGPDHYFTNIDSLRGRTVELYETAMLSLIESMGEENVSPSHITKRRGDLTLRVEGRSAERLRRLLRR